MITPSLSDLDQIRNAGFRPQIVGCLLADKKILFVYKKEHELWQLPQGGIDNKETLEQAFFREMAEELGAELVISISKELQVVGEDEMKFSAAKQGSRELKNDAGKEIFMVGKKYFFVAVQVKAEVFDLANSEFNDFEWSTFEEAEKLCKKIYQHEKKRVTLKALGQLQTSGLL
ncbi:MAG: RNA pyrophosphohydrolase [Candidatus Uhrbacteria bacterium GW2011_GWE2_45_35]|uniref:RNA pyrophosphohydrolase n=2 Tax=Candidatus Uhriibacteriota TaxID=1752732 RepID=A0A0G1JJ38_9BACT|nr:MAG: RNA pyrophosphohydrolase [Candidatus Uhrbacteria bacterium GW2011_GWF2_44_350]KKU08312.1 MAG: RNA pyrophosphohydrolase [Candidatus Uhrbacteria bacterium GW2011_GWE2_45_35]HBR81026.1 hypothetical protein [Candidatus Uhrbacteria bacterium]HCU31818.1 hypothetical protein [Candidatus Uhrbacteria bacterium]